MVGDQYFLHVVMKTYKWPRLIYRGSNMSAHVLLNLLYELGKRDARPFNHFITFSQQD